MKSQIQTSSLFRILSKAIRLVHRDRRGLTLLELLIAIALAAVVTTAVTMTLSQTFTGGIRSSNHMAAIRHVQETGYWVSFYTYMAQDATITGESGFPLILHWVDFGNSEGTPQRQKIEFSLNDLGLRGLYYVEGVLDAAKSGKIPAFEYIDPDKAKTNCQASGGSDFNLPDIGDAFTITGGEAADSGRIILTTGSVSFATTGDAAYSQVAGSPNTWTWSTEDTEADSVKITATSSGTKGTWTSNTQATIAAITADTGAQSGSLSNCRVVVFTVTATVGTGWHEASETRIYNIVPKPVS